MSRPAASTFEVPASANVEQVEEVSSEVSNSSPELIRRVVFECNAKGSELANGVTVHLNNSEHIFTPSMASDLTAEEKAAFEERDFTKGIVTSMTLKSVSSSCPETVTVGMNLFSNAANVANSKGWLYAREVSDLSDNHAHQNEGYSNVATILPHERQRPNEVVYHPEGLMNSRWIKQYGGYTLDKLHEGITRFKGKDYCYVPDDHDVVSIIRNN